ncbi:MAG: TolC family protein [Bernardetiaceae bacterium]|nr:TolC family protein [Bernardetiaceae bacterium]
MLNENARQEIRLARGGFDPKLNGGLDFKEFANTLYYRQWTGEIKAATITGLEIKAGYEQIGGVYINPRDLTPGAGLMYVGVGVPLGQGLLIDARRAALREAQYGQSIAEAERIKLINKVILQATKDYWAWYAAHNSLRIAQEGLDLADFRYRAVVERMKFGDLPGIDTTQALATLQERQIALNDAQVAFTNARLILSNHLWSEEGTALELLPNNVPTPNLNELSRELPLEELLSFARANHPELVKLNFKLKQQAINRRLAAEMLKPVFNVNYNLLTQTISPFQDQIPGAFLRNNYKLGLEFAMPLFMRKERAKLAQANIKIEQTEFERTQAMREIDNYLQASYNELLNLRQQLRIQESMVNQYQVLRDGEEERFQLGESSLILVNIQETKLLEGKQKLVDFQFKFAKARAELLWAAGKGWEF